MISYSLYLDDKRNPKDYFDWVVARSVREAKEYVNGFGMPSFISFDHDLGEEESGYDFAKWLCEEDMNENKFPPDFEYKIHSANPVGADNIRKYMDNYLKHRKDTISNQLVS